MFSRPPTLHRAVGASGKRFWTPKSLQHTRSQPARRRPRGGMANGDAWFAKPQETWTPAPAVTFAISRSARQMKRLRRPRWPLRGWGGHFPNSWRTGHASAKSQEPNLIPLTSELGRPGQGRAASLTPPRARTKLAGEDKGRRCRQWERTSHADGRNGGTERTRRRVPGASPVLWAAAVSRKREALPPRPTGS